MNQKTPNELLAHLLQDLSMGQDAAGNVHFTGSDPVIPSRFRLGTASAVALAAQAAAVREIWRLRAGENQRLDVDVRQAAYPGLCTFLHIRQGGHKIPFVRNWGGESGNFFETRDGRRFYLLHTATYIEHCLRIHRFMGATTSIESLREKVRGWNAEALEDALAEQKLVGAYARTRQEWLEHPQGRWLSERGPVEVKRTQSSAPEPFRPGVRPLSGIRVVDMGHVLAGPITSRVLAEQGAEVIHVSAPHQPDGHLTDVDTGFGKRTAFIDLNDPQDQERLRALISTADVFIHSWRQGSLDRRGFSAAALAELRPGLVHAALSCYGHGGPWAERGGYEPLGQTVSGLAIAEGSAEAPQLVSTFTLNDYLTAYLASAGILSALLQRSRDGGSYEVNASLTRTSMWAQELGQLPEDCWPGRPHGVTQMPAVEPGWMTQTDSVFGMLSHPRPIVRYEKTPSYWARPPMPAGASVPTWMDGILDAHTGT